MRSIYKVIVLLMISFSYQGCGNEDLSSSSSENVDVNFTVLQSSEGGQYLNHSKIFKVIQTQNEYVNELAKYSSEEVPSIDFTAYNVVLADLGVKSNNSYFLEIPSVYEDAKGNLHVVVLSKEASGDNCTASDVITNPYVFVKIPAGKDVYFDERVEYYSCP